jgi:N,N'-diacetyllegionaminate synthase
VIVEIIAELGQGFEGRPAQARLLMRAAAAAGADAAKYQLVYADELATADYKHYDLFKSLEMSDEMWEELGRYASELKIQLHLDIFGARSLQVAERVGAAAVKIHPTDIANVGLLEEVARSLAPRVLLGAGGTSAADLRRALEILTGKPVVVLLGFQTYPTPDDANQIARLRLLADRFGRMHPALTLGFADHAPPESPLRYALAATAIGAGAMLLEKHLTLGRGMQLEDFESALNPDEFAEFVQVVRGCAQAYGVSRDTDDFGMSESEKLYRRTIQRHVVARRPLEKGDTLGPADLTLKRTSAEHPITDLQRAYTKTLRRSVDASAPILAADLE